MNQPAYYKQKAQEEISSHRGIVSIIVIVSIIISLIPEVINFFYPTQSIIRSLVFGEVILITPALMLSHLYYVVFSAIALLVCVWLFLACLDLYRGDEKWREVKYKRSAPRLALAALVVNALVFAWSLLLIVPGIIKSIAYSQVLFILKDNPELSIKEAIKESEAMMKGHILEYLKLWFSFIGLIILSIFTLGLGLIYMLPNMYTAMAIYYVDLKAEQDL